MLKLLKEDTMPHLNTDLYIVQLVHFLVPSERLSWELT